MYAKLLPTCAVAASAIALALLTPSPQIAAQNLPESFTAFAVNMNSSGPRTFTLDMKIERWSTDAEREKLLGILVEKKKDRYRANQDLLKAIQRMPKAGYIRTTRTLAWDLHYARQAPLEDGGRQIILGTDRPVGFWEARNQPRTMDYPFTVLEIRLNKENKGEGKLLVGTQLYIDKNNNLVLENYAIQPVMLNEIRPLK
jgi:hypothetical protein